MFPTDFIMYSYFCVNSCDVGADKGIRELPANVKNSICSFCFYWDECRRSRRAGARGPRSRPGTDLRPDTSAASSAPFLHPNVSSSGAAPLHHRLWAELKNKPLPPLQLPPFRLLPPQQNLRSSLGARATCMRTRSPRRALQRLVYSIHHTPFLSKAWPSVDVVNVFIGKREYLASYFCRI